MSAPLFIRCFMAGAPILINVANIVAIRPTFGEVGCIIHGVDDHKYQVKESFETIERAIRGLGGADAAPKLDNDS